MHGNESLLQSLKQLYSKLHFESLQQRIQNYFHVTHSHQHDISKTLHQLIDELVNDVSHHAIANTATENKQSDQQRNHQALHRKPADKKDDETVLDTKDSLSFYFKNSKAQEKDPSTAVMLRRRIWEHVHSARRLAREGDKQSATMHADIAAEGLKTLAHYMPADAHHEFFLVIVNQLSNNSNDNDLSTTIKKYDGH